jgi:hypothetical protein
MEQHNMFKFFTILAFCLAFLVLVATPAQCQDILRNVIGIDLGSTYTRVGVFKNDQVEIIATLPSYVFFDPETGERLIGDAAKNQTYLNPSNTIFQINRFLGREYTVCVMKRKKYWSQYFFACHVSFHLFIRALFFFFFFFFFFL